MRYSIRGREIRSENSAKPTTTPNRWLLHWFKHLPPESIVLDLGCGKLRYTIPLARTVRQVIASDSRHQLKRKQTINRTPATTIVEYVANHLPNVRAVPLDDLPRMRRRFDLILTAFVLSAIPSAKVRVELLKSAATLLKRRTGKILVVTNYANSRYKRWESTTRAQRYRDGYLIANRHGTSFYGLIGLNRLRRYCNDAGLELVRHGCFRTGNAYVLAMLQRP